MTAITAVYALGILAVLGASWYVGRLWADDFPSPVRTVARGAYAVGWLMGVAADVATSCILYEIANDIVK